jgi:hypothetical protein
MNGRDWVEDENDENGNYRNRCIDCGLLFTGHKRRVTCRGCTNSPCEKCGSRKRLKDYVRLGTDCCLGCGAFITEQSNAGG